MASFSMDDYASDDDHVNDEQIQYTYIDEEIAPVEGLVDDEIENHNLGLVDIEEYERVRDQAEDLDGRNWDLRLKCKIYELELRILKRSISERIRDRVYYCKEIATDWRLMTMTWLRWMYQQATEDAFIYRTPRRFRDILESRYYPYDLHLE